jgi:hypothetical protein
LEPDLIARNVVVRISCRGMCGKGIKGKRECGFGCRSGLLSGKASHIAILLMLTDAL